MKRAIFCFEKAIQLKENNIEAYLNLANIYKENKKFYVKNLDSMNISYFDSIKFKRIMRNSIFSLCPRGFGPTSFRLYEAIQMGTIPVYIAEKNEHVLPFANKIDWKK